MALTFVNKYVKAPGIIDDRRIGDSVSVEVRPGKLAYAGDSGKGVDGGETTITVVPQHNRAGSSRSKHNVERAIRFNVRSPGTLIPGVQQRPRQPGLVRYVDEVAVTFLAKESHTTLSC